MRTIRCSELGAYLFCERAWWYQQQGIVSQNEAELNTGTELHQAFSRTVFASVLLKLAGWVLLTAGLVLAIYYLVSRII